MSEHKTVEINAEQLADHALAVLCEMPDRDHNGEKHWKTYWDWKYDDEILADLKKIPKGVEAADVDGFLVTFTGGFTTPVTVGTQPAGPNRGYGPINPPEPITEEVLVEFELVFDMSDLGTAYIEMHADAPAL